jgi:hypothetical protein
MVLDFFAPKYGAKRDWLILWSIAGIVQFLIIFFVPTISPSQSANAGFFDSPLAMVILAPLLEEVEFRSWLVDKKWYLLVGAASSAIFLLQFLTGIGFSDGAVTLLIGLFFLGLFALRFNFKTPVTMSRGIFISGVLSTFAFALVHVFDRSGWESFTHLQALLSVLPQLVAGFLIWVARTRIGLHGAIALHAANNVIPAMLDLAPGIGFVLLIVLPIINCIILYRSRKWEPMQKLADQQVN